MSTKPDPTGRRRNHALWIGPLVAFAGGVSYFLVFASYPTLRDFPWVNLPLVLIGLAVSALGMWRAYSPATVYRGRVLGPISLAGSSLFCLSFVFYIFAMSYWLPEPSLVTRKLTTAPDFTLVDHDGRDVRLEDYRGRKVVLTFYRGFW